MSESDGVTHVRFDGTPGDVIFIAAVKSSGSKHMTFEDTNTTHSSTTYMAYDNSLVSLFAHALFTIISIPILRRLLMTKSNENVAEQVAASDR